MVDKQYLAGKTGEELKELIAQYGMPRFTASQIAAWLYRNRVKNINQMTNLSKINREKLSADFEIGYTEPIEANRRKTEQSNIFLPPARISSKPSIFPTESVRHCVYRRK